MNWGLRESEKVTRGLFQYSSRRLDDLEGLPRMDWILVQINGNFRILKWSYVSTIFQAIFCGGILLHRLKKIGQTYMVSTSNKPVPESWPLNIVSIVVLQRFVMRESHPG